MTEQELKEFDVIGISVRTSNEAGRAAIDIPALWQRFMAEGIADKIPNKTDASLYCIYTDYEKDHTRPYTTVLGCRVTRTDEVPQGMVHVRLGGGSYAKRLAKGNLMQGVVFTAWTEIWNSDLERRYTSDFEVYGPKAQNPEDAEVEIFVAVR